MRTDGTGDMCRVSSEWRGGAKDFGHTLRKILGSAYENKTDLQSDYFDQGKAVLFESHPLYAAARARAEMV